jgi:uncharacterized repeat protein (TIGR01451 family)
MASVTLTGTKTTVSTSYAPGSTITYTITLTASAPGSATGVTFTDNAPAGTTIIAFTQQAPGGFTLTNTPPGFPTNSVTASAGTVASGTPQVFNVTIQIPATGAPATVTNAITATSATAPTTFAPFASAPIALTSFVSITKTNSPVNVTPGTQYQSTIVVTNNSATPIVGATITDTLPPGVTFISSVPLPTSVIGNVVTFSGVTLAPAPVTATFVITSLVNSSTASGQILTNTAAEVDPANAAPVTAFIVTGPGSADLSVVKTGPSFVCKGQPATYIITLTNLGLSDATNVVLTDTLPVGAKLAVTGFTQLSGPTFFISPPTFSGPGAASLVTATVATFAAGATAVFQLILCLKSKCSPQVVNRVSVISSTFDPNFVNNSSSVITTIIDKRKK